jgi:O-antigen ligase
MMKRIQSLALLIFFFSLNFEIWDPFHTKGYFSISKLTGYLYLLSMIPMLIHNKTSEEINRLLRPIWIFFTLLTIVSITHINSVYSQFFDLSIFQNIILLWILLNHEQKEELVLEKGMLSFALGSIALSLLFIAGIGIEYVGGRVSIFGDNQNSIGLRMSISIIIILTIVLQKRMQLGKFRFLLLIPIPIMLILIAESGSRIAFISFILAFSTGGLLLKTSNIGKRILSLGIGIIIFIVIWHFLLQYEILATRLLSSIQEGDLAERDIIWQGLVPLIKRNPLFGVGIPGYSLYNSTTLGFVDSPHNVILEVLCLTGITGLFFYLIFLYRIFRGSLNYYRMNGFVLPLILFIPISGLILSAQMLNVKLGWVIIAYISGSSILNPTEKEY